jgi:hypothetical protein
MESKLNSKEAQTHFWLLEVEDKLLALKAMQAEKAGARSKQKR